MDTMLEDVFVMGSEQFKQLIEFLKLVDWKEPWLIGLILFHLLVMLLIFFTRKLFNFQAVLFFLLLLGVYFSENINKLGATHWRYFSKKQYFDPNGVFICLVFSAPILIQSLIMIVLWLYYSSQMLVKVKRAQLREQKQQTDQKKTDGRKDK